MSTFYTLQLRCNGDGEPLYHNGKPVIAIFAADAYYYDTGVAAATADMMKCSVGGAWYSINADGAWRLDPNNLTTAEVGTLTSAILVVVAIAWIFRNVLRQISNRR